MEQQALHFVRHAAAALTFIYTALMGKEFVMVKTVAVSVKWAKSTKSASRTLTSPTCNGPDTNAIAGPKGQDGF